MLIALPRRLHLDAQQYCTFALSSAFAQPLPQQCCGVTL
jgi:hypothetical protein